MCTITSTNTRLLDSTALVVCVVSLQMLHFIFEGVFSYFYFGIFNCRAPVHSLFCAFSSRRAERSNATVLACTGGGRGKARHALFFSASLLRQMSHSHVPIKNNRCCTIIFCAFTYLIIVESWCDTDVFGIQCKGCYIAVTLTTGHSFDCFGKEQFVFRGVL